MQTIAHFEAVDTVPADRAAWRAAVAEIAAKAHAKLPECNGRVDSAVKIVLAGDVELISDGTARVASQSNGTTTYHIVNGHCDCKDFAKAPHGFCKHRLSAAIARRAQELVKATPTPSHPTPAPLPEAPASVNIYLTVGGRQAQLTLRDSDEGRLLARLDAVWLPAAMGHRPAPQPHQDLLRKQEPLGGTAAGRRLLTLPGQLQDLVL